MIKEEFNFRTVIAFPFKVLTVVFTILSVFFFAIWISILDGFDSAEIGVECLKNSIDEAQSKFKNKNGKNK